MEDEVGFSEDALDEEGSPLRLLVDLEEDEAVAVVVDSRLRVDEEGMTRLNGLRGMGRRDSQRRVLVEAEERGCRVGWWMDVEDGSVRGMDERLQE